MAQSPAAPHTFESPRETGPLPAGSAPSLRVLHLNSGNIMGGVESMLLTLAEFRELRPALAQSFALTFDSDFAARLRRTGSKVHLLPQVRLRHLPSVFESRRQLRLLLKEFGFDVVISHSPWIQVIFGDVVRDCGLPLVFWMHNEFNGHWLQRLASFHPPDFAICNSQFTRSTLERCYPRVPSTVLYYPVRPPVSAKNRDDIRAAIGIKPEEVVILSAARMDPWKGHHNLVSAAAKLPSSLPWRVLIAGAPNNPGDTRYFDQLKREAAALSLTDRVRFLGFRSDIPDLMSACDIHCQPNDAPEPFGIVFVEALQAGVPVVTYAMGGPREILDESTGILVPPADIDAIAASLTRLIEDRELSVQLGSAGPRRALALCDPARQMQKLSDTLQSVVTTARGVTVA